MYREIMVDSEKVLLIGAGSFGRIHARVLDRLRVLAGIVDPADSAKAVADKHNVPYYKTLDEALQDGREFLAAVIAAPTSYHAKLAVAAIKSGAFKAILVEKPLAHTQEEVDMVVSVANSSDVKVVVGHLEVYNPICDRIIQAVESGAVGELRNIFIERRGSVQKARIQSVGEVIEDLGAHDLDLLSRLMHGEATIYSTATRVDGVPNAATILLTSGNTVATLALSRGFAGKERNMIVEGSKATLTADLLAQIMEIRSLEPTIGDSTSSRIPFKLGEKIKAFGEPLFEEHSDLLRVAKGECEPRVGLENGVKAVKLILAARESLEIGKPISIVI